MITTTKKARGKKLPWLLVALLSIALGGAAFVQGVFWKGMETDGWPWHMGISYTPGTAQGIIDVEHPGGRTEIIKVAGSEAAVTAAQERVTERLKNEYNINQRITAGRVLEPVGLFFVVLGGGLLVWRATRMVGRREPRPQTTTS